MVTNKSHDRAQMILIGGIVIAFVILATIVAFNGLVHTEELSSSSTGQSATDVSVMNSEITQDLQTIAVKSPEIDEDDDIGEVLENEDAEDVFLTEAEWQSMVEDNYEPEYRSAKAQNRSVVFDIESANEGQLLV
ncbi:hypothetical protein D8S78_10770 [Natrialba swarupiae]|nr:hypothetical protein [Natrialba swarupiae]